MKHFKLHQEVRVSPENDNDCYNSFRDEVLVITHITKETDNHPAYDKSVSPEYLYDLQTKEGANVGCALYDYELIPA